MDKIWILSEYGSADPKAFRSFEHAFASYREYIEERTSGMDWTDKEFEWNNDIYNNNKKLRHLSCYCYGEFVAELHEVELNG